MKYIRTKDGVYEVVTTERGSDNKLLYIISTSKSDTSTDWIHEGDVIKQADTIEELCDWFFLEGAKGNPIDYKKLYTAKRAKERMQIEHDLYGVIHIKGKGLIYVAKMNEKGELELI